MVTQDKKYGNIRGKRKQAYLVCPTCPTGTSWVYKTRAGQSGWEHCKQCGHRWADFSSAPSPCHEGNTANAVALEALLKDQYIQAKAKEDHEKVKLLESVCPKLADLDKVQPEQPVCRQLEAAAQRLRKEQMTQDRIKRQLMQNAEQKKELLLKLNDNIDKLMAEQAEVDRLVKLARPPEQPAAEPPTTDDDIPELTEEDLGLLDQQSRTQYTEAAKVAKQAQALLQQARDACSKAKEAANTLRQVHGRVKDAKRRRTTAGTEAGQEGATNPEGAASKPQEGGVGEEDGPATSDDKKPFDFTDPSAVDKYIEQRVQIKGRKKAAAATAAPTSAKPASAAVDEAARSGKASG